MHQGPRILHHDDDIAIVDKPGGLIVHSNKYARREPNLINTVGGMLQRRVYSVHRLDRGTSGLMVFALTKDAAGVLSAQFRGREVEKRYLAAVRGHPDDTGTVDKPLRHGDDVEGRAATTHFRTLARGEVNAAIGPYETAWVALVELTLVTGRSHQARRHMQNVNHPVIGDQRHGDRAYNRYLWEHLDGERHLLLRALELRFTHPRSGAGVTAYAGIPAVWQRALSVLELPLPPFLPHHPHVE